MADDADPNTGSKSLSYWWFAAIVIVYLVIIQGGGRLVAAIWDTGDGPTSTRDVILNMWVPLGASFLFTYAVIAFLGWWDPVLRDRKPVQRWVWAVPVILIVAILIAIDYSALADSGLGLVLSLLVATQLVGWGEEGMFRGVGVTVLRRHGLTEGKVALWSSLIFGSVHLTNALGTGGKAIPQAIAVSFAGYFFYLVRRVSGGNVLNSVLHGMFDFSILSGTAILVDQQAYPATIAAILAYVVLAVLLLIRRHHIEPKPATAVA